MSQFVPAASSRRTRRSGSSQVPRPDPRALLLAAIQARDTLATSRLVEQWVHRRGVASLESFQRLTVASVHGPETCAWLQRLIDEPRPVGFGAGDPWPGFHTPSGEPGQEAEASFLGQATSTVATPTGEALIVVASQGEPPAMEATQPSSDEAHRVTLVSDSLAAFDPWAIVSSLESSPAESNPEPVPSSGEWGTPFAQGAPLSSEEEVPSDAAAAPRRPSPLAHGLRKLSRARTLMRDCVEEALGAFRGSHAWDQEEFEEETAPISPSDSPSFSPPAPVSVPTTSASTEATAGLRPIAAKGAEDVLPALPAGTPVPLPWTAPAPLSTAAPHRESTLATPAWDPAPASAPVTEPSGFDRLRELRRPTAGQAPAPSPAALADLRSWLPDPGGDLPRAC